MANTIHKLAVQMSVNDKGFDRKMRRAGKSVRRTSSGIGTMGKVAIGAAVGIAALTKGFQLATKAARALVDMIDEQRKVVDKLAKSAKKLSILPGELERMRTQAGLFAGVEGPQFDKAIQKMQVSVGDLALNGTATLRRAFESLGLELEDVLGLDAQSQFYLVRDALSEQADESIRAAAAQAIFGRSGKELIPLFKATRQELDQSAASLEGYFQTLNRADLASVEAANDNIALMVKGLDAVKTMLVVEIGPALRVMTEAWQGLDPQTQQELFQMFATTVEHLIVVLATIPKILEIIMRRFTELGKMIRKITEAVDLAIEGKFVKSSRALSSAGNLLLEVTHPQQIIKDAKSVAQSVTQTTGRIALIKQTAKREAELKHAKKTIGFLAMGMTGRIPTAAQTPADRKRLSEMREAETKRKNDSDREWQRGATTELKRLNEQMEGGKTVLATIGDFGK